jgi:hypothetical protein
VRLLWVEQPLLDRLKRAANNRVSQVSAISGRTLAAAQAHLNERNARRERLHSTVSDARYEALARLQQGEPAGAELEALWARSPSAAMDALPQLCAHLIVSADQHRSSQSARRLNCLQQNEENLSQIFCDDVS